jgi:hypothetical protein
LQSESGAVQILNSGWQGGAIPAAPDRGQRSATPKYSYGSMRSDRNAARDQQQVAHSQTAESASSDTPEQPKIPSGKASGVQDMGLVRAALTELGQTMRRRSLVSLPDDPAILPYRREAVAERLASGSK